MGKINKQEALEMGKEMCPVVIEMYAEDLKSLVDQISSDVISDQMSREVIL